MYFCINQILIQMENIILHSTPLKEFRDIIGSIVEEKLQQFKPAETPQTNSSSEYLTRKEVCDLGIFRSNDSYVVTNQ